MTTKSQAENTSLVSIKSPKNLFNETFTASDNYSTYHVPKLPATLVVHGFGDTIASID